MKQFTPEQKHSILLEYTPYSRHHSFSSLAVRHSVPGGKQTVHNWYQRWDGTIESLQRKPVSGRPRILTPAEVTRHVRLPIQRANRSFTRIHYPQIHRLAMERTGKSPRDFGTSFQPVDVFDCIHENIRQLAPDF